MMRTLVALLGLGLGLGLGLVACDDSRSRLDGVNPAPTDGMVSLDAMPDASDVMRDAMLDASRMARDAMPASGGDMGDMGVMGAMDAMDAMDAMGAMPDAIVDMGPPPADCPFVVETVPVAELRDYEPFVDGETVYFGEPGPNGIVRTVRARDRAPVGGPSDTLLAVQDGAFLLVRPDGDGGQRLIYRDADGDVPLAERFFWPFGAQRFDWRAPTWVEPGEAIHIVDERLYHWDGGQVRLVDDGVAEAVLWRGHVSYVKRVPDGEGQVEWWLDGRRIHELALLFTTGTLSAAPDGVRMGSGGVVHHFGWDGTPRQTWAMGPDADVVAIDASAASVVFTVRGGDGSFDLFFPRTGETWPVPVGGAVTARLAAADVVVARWPGQDAWCHGMLPGRIELRTVDGVAPIGEVYTGCLCCGRYWPRFVIDASPTTIAWSYAGPDGSPAIGIARRRCD